MKKQLLTIILGAALIAPTAQAAAIVQQIQNNIGTIKSALGDFQKVATNQVLPIVDRIYTDIDQGNFQDLRTYLKANIGNLNLTPILSFLSTNLPKLKDVVLDALKQIPMSSIPSDKQGLINTIKSNIQQHVSIFDSLAAQVQTLQYKINPATLSNAVDALVDSLQAVANSREYAMLKPELASFYQTQIVPTVNTIATVNVSTLETSGQALVNVLNQYAQGQTPDLLGALPQIAPGIGELRKKVFPALISFAGNFAQFFVKINNMLATAKDANGNLIISTWPANSQRAFAELQKILRMIQNNAVTLSNMLQNANNSINQAVGQAAIAATVPTMAMPITPK